MDLNKLFFLLLLGAVTTLSSCSDDDNNNEDDNKGSESKEMVLTGYKPLGRDANEPLPITIDGVSWTYGVDNKIKSANIYTSSYDMKYLNDKIEIINTGVVNGEEVEDTIIASLEDGRIRKIERTNNYYKGKPSVKNFYYDAQGFLVRISEINSNNVEIDIIKATVNNGNVVKVEEMDYSLWSSTPFATTTYTYTYDNNKYVPMNDWGPFTLRYFAAYPLVMVYDDFLGTKSKNNITRLDVEYTEEQFSPQFNYITFEPIFDKDDKLTQINHTGQYIGWKSEGSPVVNFSKAQTSFSYTEKDNK